MCVIQTVVHEHAFTKSSDVSYDVERTLVIRSWNKLIVKVEDDRVEIGRTEINLRGLCRGIKVVCTEFVQCASFVLTYVHNFQDRVVRPSTCWKDPSRAGGHQLWKDR